MRPKVSIILPAYNAEAYLAECLDSLLAQTLKDIEILLIDDGSTDGTRAIALAYAERDTRLFVHTKAHGGVSAARNAGLERAQGEAIGFCDADDFVRPEMYGRLYDALLQNDAQVSFCGVIKQRPTGDEPVPLPWPEGTTFDKAAIRGELIPQMISLPQDGEALPVSGYTPRNLFSRELLSGIRFREDIHYAEDLLFIITALLQAERAVVVSDLLYTYRFHGGSTTQRYVPEQRRAQEACHQALEALFAQEGIEEALAPRMAIRRRRSALSWVSNLCLPGTPYPPRQRLRAIGALLRDPEVQALFRGLKLSNLSPKLRVKYACMQRGWALPLLLFYSYAYHSR